ncbi:MAG: hypothetical protein EON95_14225 [Caulobacteraceae bacterium]|nr:hypothetical protein [Caulobacter sp.]RYF91837.1 MAG: hypothetical protein EON95_14225 [Caulobacteraceae bacterium]
MSDEHQVPEPPPEAAPPPAAPAVWWKTPWAIGGGALLALVIGYQFMQQSRGPEIQVRPINPNETVQGPGQANTPPGGPQGFGPPQAPPAAGQDVWPVAQPGQPAAPFQPGPNQPAPQGPQPQQPPQQAAPVTPVQPPGGMVERDGQSVYPMLAKPGGDLPWVNVQYTPYIGSVFDFSLLTPEGTAIGNVMIPDGWEAGWVTVTISQSKNAELMSFGASTADGGRLDNAPIRVVRPNWTVDKAQMGGLCFAFIGGKGQSDVTLTEANFCVMDRTCGQAYACGKLRR